MTFMHRVGIKICIAEVKSRFLDAPYVVFRSDKSCRVAGIIEKNSSNSSPPV